MDRDIEQHQRAFGQVLDWYFYDPDTSTFDDVYDEGQDKGGGGRRWKGPVPIPVVSANRREGQKSLSDDGRYVVDTIDIRMSYEQARRAGLSPEIALNTEHHINDRFVYDNRVWGIRDISVSGQFELSGHDTMVRILGVQLRPDELVNDQDFRRWAPSSEDESVEEAALVLEVGVTFRMQVEWTDDNGINVPLAGLYTAEFRVAVDRDPDTVAVYVGNLASGVTLAAERDVLVRIGGPSTSVFAPYAGTKLVFDLDLFEIGDPTESTRLAKGTLYIDGEVP